MGDPASTAREKHPTWPTRPLGHRQAPAISGNLLLEFVRVRTKVVGRPDSKSSGCPNRCGTKPVLSNLSHQCVQTGKAGRDSVL